MVEKYREQEKQREEQHRYFTPGAVIAKVATPRELVPALKAELENMGKFYGDIFSTMARRLSPGDETTAGPRKAVRASNEAEIARNAAKYVSGPEDLYNRFSKMLGGVSKQ